MLAMVCVMIVAPIGNGQAGKANAVSGVKNFTILHTNDEHSELIPYDLARDYPGNPTTGGFSRLAKTITDIKTAKAKAGEPVLTLGSGDWSQGTLFSWLETSASPELTLMQKMGYDAVTIGNHEVELGPQYLAAELNAAKVNGVNLPVLSSNIKFSGTPPAPSSPDHALYGFYSTTDQHRSGLYIQPYTTKTLSNGLKVGMFGLMGIEAEAVAPGESPLSFGNIPGDPTSPFSFVNRVNAAQSMVNALRNTEHCDVVVCLSHQGTYEDKLLAAFVPTIDVIVGGHSHDLDYPAFTWGTGGTIIVQAKAYTEYLGDLELKYDPGVTSGPKVTVRSGKAIHMDETVGTVPAIDAVINNFLGAINAHLGFNALSSFAETDVKGDGGFPIVNRELRETNLGDLITDMYKSAVNKVDPTHPTRIVIEGNGVIRSNIVRGATGVFSFYDLYRALPLGGSPYDPATPGYPIVSFYLFGAEIQGVLNQVLDMNRDDFFLQSSGMKYTYNPEAGTGKKLVSVTVDDGSGKYKPIQPGTLYKIATNYYTGSFLASFGLYPRDGTGAQHKPPTYPDPMKEFIVHTAPSVELKAWQALTSGVAHMADLDGDGLPNIPPTYYATQQRITAQANTFYFAEGTCRPDFDPYIAIKNQGSGDAKVKITYMLGNGKSKTQVIVIPARSRGTVHPPDVLGIGNDPAHDFSAKVECINGQQIVAERPMYFNYNGVWTGGHDAVGATSPASAFYFAEGTCRPNFEPYFTVLNPGDADANVTITYMKGDGTTDTQSFTVTKGSRYTVTVKDKLGVGDDPAHDFSAKVECTNGQGIVAERPMYFNYNGQWTGGSDVVGETAPSPTYYFAEGTCRPGFDPYIAIANPGNIDTKVKVTYALGDGSAKTQDIMVPANSRRTVHPPDVLGTGDDAAHDFSASLQATNNQPIVAERPMYFNYQGSWTGGHDIIGADMPALSYDFAEGTCRPGFDPYIAVANPSASDAKVKITYSLGDGRTKTQDLTVPAHSRRTVHPPDILGTGDNPAHDFSAKVESTNGRPIIAERPMYFDYMGWTGGSCVLGY